VTRPAVTRPAVTRRAGPALLALLLAGGLAGCSSDSASAVVAEPLCPVGDDDAGNGVILMAQSVPTASWVPCIRTALPLGWDFHHLDVRDGLSRFSLNSDRDGQQAVEVRLERTCDTDDATEILSDRPGMRRFERIRQISPTFDGERQYLFDGGCLSVVFQLDGDSPGEALALASQTIGVMSRDDLRAQVREATGGRIELDPPAPEEG
jgi:hypothetical protein